MNFSDGTGGLADTTQAITVTPAATTKLVYVSRPLTMTAATVSGAFVVERRDVFNNANRQGNLTVNLTSSSPGVAAFFCAAPGCPGFVTSVVIPNNSASIPFYYRDTLAATHVITADSGGGRTPAVASITVEPGPAAQLRFINPSRTITAGTTSDLLTIQLQDASGNAITPTLPNQVSVALATTNLSGTGAFRNADNTAYVTAVSIANSATASFRYTDTRRPVHGR